MSCFRLTFLVSAVAMFAWPASEAYAQGWLPDRTQREGRGIQVGSLELHPGIGAEVGYDSNWLRRSNNGGANVLNGPPNAPRLDAAVLRLTPSFSMRTVIDRKLPPPVAFDLALHGTYREFMGVSLMRQQRNFGGGADAKVMIAPYRPVSFDILGGYTRMIRPNSLGDPEVSFNISTPYVGGLARFQPGMGNLELSAGYKFSARLFENPEARGFSHHHHSVDLTETWRFRPLTSLFHATNIGYYHYFNESVAATRVLDSSPLRTRFGLNGLLFDRFAATAAAGYGASFVERNSAAARQYDSVIGNVELRMYLTGKPNEEVTDFLPGTRTMLNIGAERDFQMVFLANVATIHRGYVGLSAHLGGRVLLSVKGSLGAYTYQPVYLNDGAGGEIQVTESFTVVRPQAGFYGEYRFSNSLALTLDADYSQAISDQVIPYNNFTPPGVFAMSWQRFRAFAGVRWFL